jgi:N-sulfoglucosamine sulfohydrolase
MLNPFSRVRLGSTRLLVIVALAFLFPPTSRSKAVESLEGSRPNIIFIITDDQGYGDIASHGNPILKTPNLDRMRTESFRFVDFHVSPTCAPTRSALMTGRHEFKNGVTHTILERERLTQDATTLAQVLHQSGYATGIFGKWHLGDEPDYQPNKRGFDETFIHGAGGIGQTYAGSCGDAPNNKYHNPTILHNGVFEDTKGYCTDVFFDQATSWIGSQRESGKPFLAWIATNAPHGPYVAKAEDFQKYQESAPSATVAHFFGMIDNIDANVGKLLNQLDSWNIADNTLVVYVNDNGGTAGTEVFNAGMRGQKGTPWLGGTRATSFWRWPKKLAATECKALTAHVDVFPTLASLAGADLSEKVQKQVEGRSLLPILSDPTSEWSDRTLVTHVGRWPKGDDRSKFKYRSCSIRNSRWHLVSNDGNDQPQWQLFDVSNDYGETKNLAAESPEVVKELAQAYDRWWDEIQPSLVNEDAVGPPENSFKTLYWQQRGRQPASTSLPRKPNILFCFADDWGRYASCYSKIEPKASINSVVSTPNIDRIATEGVMFRNAFAPCPSCTPCRSSLIAGQYFWRSGKASILQGAQWDNTLPSFALSIRDSGYDIGKFIKVWSPGTPADAPFGAQKYAFEQAGREYNNFSENALKRIAAGESVDDAKSKLLAGVSNDFEKFLSNRKPNQPFLFWFGPTLVHREFGEGSGTRLWGIDPDLLRGKLPAFLPDVPEIRQDVADYLGEIQAWDAGIGVLLRKLEAIGELDNTIIVLSGDHGMPGMPRGKCNLYDFGTNVPLIVRGPGIKPNRVIDDLVNLMDLSPTFLELARLQAPEVMQAKSLMPLLYSDQSGFIDPSRDFVITGRERHVAKARSGNLPYPQRALRTKDFLYVHNFKPERWPMGDPADETLAATLDRERLVHDTFVTFADLDASPTKAWLIQNRDQPEVKRYYEWAFAKRPAEELYDLTRDPDQVKNVADLPQYATKLESLRTRLFTELRNTGDPRVLDDGHFYENLQ